MALNRRGEGRSEVRGGLGRRVFERIYIDVRNITSLDLEKEKVHRKYVKKFLSPDQVHGKFFFCGKVISECFGVF